MVDTRTGKSTTPSEAEQARIASLLREKKEKRELLEQAKLKAIEEEAAAKKKRLEEEMLRIQKEKLMLIEREKEERRKAAEEEAAREEEEEKEPLERRCKEERGEVSGTKEDDRWREKKISEWVANLSLGEDEEAQLYVPQEEREAFARALELIEDPLERLGTKDEKKLEWKLKMMREKKRRREEASRIAGEVERVQTGRQELQAQTEVSAKLDKMMGFSEILSEAWMEEHQARKGQEVTLQAMRFGFREFASDVVGHVGAEVRRLRDVVDKFCVGAIETAKVVASTEATTRPRKEPVKLKFPDPYSGKKEENFDNWEASINTYVFLQHIAPEEQVLVAFHALKDEAASFARSLTRAADCEHNMIAYCRLTLLATFLKLLRERFVDVTRGVRASDKLQTIHSRQWRSVRALKAAMDDLVVVPDHGVTEAQLVQLFYRAIPEPLRGHFFDKSQQPTMTYDALSREVVLYKARSMPVTTLWHKDLDKGKKWKGRTISSQVRAKDHMILTLEEGGTDEVPYSQIEWGLKEDRNVGQGRSYAVVAAGGRPQGRGGGQGQRGQAMGGRGSGVKKSRTSMRLRTVIAVAFSAFSVMLSFLILRLCIARYTLVPEESTEWAAGAYTWHDPRRGIKSTWTATSSHGAIQDAKQSELPTHGVDDPAVGAGQFVVEHGSTNSLQPANAPDIAADFVESYDYGDEAESLSNEEEANSKGLINTFPRTPGRYLMMVCGFGKMSNRAICILNHLVAAALLNRTLIFPLYELGYSFHEIFDMSRISKCLGNSSIVTLARYRNQTGDIGNINVMREVATTVPHKFRQIAVERFVRMSGVKVLRVEKWRGKEDGESTQDFFRRLNVDEKIMSIGDGFDVQIGPEARLQIKGYQIWNSVCQGPILQPNHRILKASLGFIRTFLGTRYSSIHLRRSDFMDFCGQNGCYFPINQVADCLVRQLHPSKTQGRSEILFLATDASPEEVSQLQSLMNRPNPGWGSEGSMIITLDGMAVTGRQKPANEKLPWRNWNSALTASQRKNPETRAMLDRTICALGAVFIASRGSTFSNEVRRIRNGWRLHNKLDSVVCKGVKPDWKQPPWS
ncbi:hypothetical protein CBR_g55863 [Chara braunii]|uniref:GDP-fucose protein O-fucosyltransferase 2 n=1 Tax=Chara braunii TaxID=69332 RepID=A0A388MD87_CHABU|nr:hypothetical protein CBR_g55863 [Chara braunii]|eukprot:GBG92528.1 hypothetical protein CBR_g55863 [Chara braunii]